MGNLRWLNGCRYGKKAAVKVRLVPLLPDRGPAYLQHRLATAAFCEATNTDVFETHAAQLIARLSGGVLRLVNVLAHMCLVLAYGENEQPVNVRHVRLAAADTPSMRASASWLVFSWSGLMGLWRRK